MVGLRLRSVFVVAVVAALGLFLWTTTVDRTPEVAPPLPAPAGWSDLVGYATGRVPALTAEASALATRFRLGPCEATCSVYPAGGGAVSFTTTSGSRVNAPVVHVNTTTLEFTSGPNGTGDVVDPATITAG